MVKKKSKFSYHDALSLAYLVASNTSEKIDDIIWRMPMAQAFKMAACAYMANTGKEVKTHEERAIIRKQQERFSEIGST